MNVWLVGAGAMLSLIAAGVEFVQYTKNKNKTGLFSACVFLLIGGLCSIDALSKAGIIGGSVWWMVGFYGIVAVVGFGCYAKFNKWV
jgi:hypothetical protein